MSGATSGGRGGRWELDREAFDALLAWLHDDRDQAAVVYQRLRRRLVVFFESRGAEEAQDLADTTLDRVARKLVGGEEIRSSDPGPYCFGVARMIVLEHWKTRERQRRAATRRPPERVPDPEREDCLDCLQLCLDALPIERRALILDYYRESGGARIERRRRMAERLGITLTALRIRAFRLREALEQCIANCLAGNETAGLTTGG